VLLGANPSEAITIAPFEKGFQFLQYIEDWLTGYYHMEDFIEYYIVKNSLASIDAFTGFRKSFAMFIETYYPNNNRVNNILWQTFNTDWIYPVGPDPTGLLDFNNTASWDAVSLANAYIALNGGGQPTGYLAYHTWRSNQ